jgi:molybdopterin-guanine dinucleotide biosynthesis protein A
MAGGSGLRMGGSKATVALHGRPLIAYPIEAVWRALGHVVVVAKPDTELPSLPGVPIWLEPETPRHPLVGLVHALEMADGRPVLACAGDLPFVTPRLVRALAAGRRGASAVLAAGEGEMQPLLGWYHPRALPALRAIDPSGGVPLREAVRALDPVLVEVDPGELFNVNTPGDLLQAAAMLDGGSSSPSRR